MRTALVENRIPIWRNRFQESRFPLIFAGLILLLVIVFFLSVGNGAVSITPAECLGILGNQLGFAHVHNFSSQQEAVLLSIRLPRVVLGVMVGATLAVSGVAMQGLFRNPLADPSLVGISSGAALGATAAILIGDALALECGRFPGMYIVPLAAFGGGLATTIVVYRLSKTNGVTNVATMLLAGIAVNALAQSLSGLLTFFSTDAQLRTVTFWKLGSLGGTSWTSVGLMAPFLLLPCLVLPRLAPALNALLLGESEAFHLGIRLESVKRNCVLLVALAIGASVAVTGLIGFVGLVVPHLLRIGIGPNHRTLIPGAALLGASLLLGADLLARTVAAPAELPIGIVTALIGAPFFLWLLVTERKKQVL